jgi:hypothetical protein
LRQNLADAIVLPACRRPHEAIHSEAAAIERPDRDHNHGGKCAIFALRSKQAEFRPEWIAFYRHERLARGFDCAISNVMAMKQKGPEIALRAFGILER